MTDSAATVFARRMASRIESPSPKNTARLPTNASPAPVGSTASTFTAGMLSLNSYLPATHRARPGSELLSLVLETKACVPQLRLRPAYRPAGQLRARFQFHSGRRYLKAAEARLGLARPAQVENRSNVALLAIRNASRVVSTGISS